jgi:hypothetical protein
MRVTHSAYSNNALVECKRQTDSEPMKDASLTLANPFQSIFDEQKFCRGRAFYTESIQNESISTETGDKP